MVRFSSVLGGTFILNCADIKINHTNEDRVGIDVALVDQPGLTFSFEARHIVQDVPR